MLIMYNAYVTFVYLHHYLFTLTIHLLHACHASVARVITQRLLLLWPSTFLLIVIVIIIVTATNLAILL